MATIDSFKRFQTDENVSAVQLNDHIKREMKKTCKYQVTTERDGVMEVEGNVKEAVLNPVTKFNAAFNTTIENGTAEIRTSGQTGFSWVFKLLALLIITIPVLYVLYKYQETKPQKVVDQILESAANDYRKR